MTLDQLRGYLWMAGASYRLAEEGLLWNVPFPLPAGVADAVDEHWDSLTQLACAAPDFTVNGMGAPTDSDADSDAEGRPC